MQWVTACDKYKEMVLFIKALGAGLIAAVVLYNTLALPTFSYVGSFVKPAKEVLRLESWGQQMITNGPWNAFPRSLLNHLKMFGFRVGCTPVSHASIAARARNGLRTLGNFREVGEQWSCSSNSDESVFWRGNLTWLDDTCFKSISAAIQYAQAKGALTPEAEASSTLQKVGSLQVDRARHFLPCGLPVSPLGPLL